MEPLDPILRPEGGRLVKADEVAARLGIPVHTLRVWIGQGRFPELRRVKLGRLMRFHADEVERLVRGELAFKAPEPETVPE
jgi:excisionase family DNA binding protein